MIYKNIHNLFRQLIYDLRPSPERLNIKVAIKNLDRKEIENFCLLNNDRNVWEKMYSHELTVEPVKEIIALKQKGDKKIEKKYLLNK